MAGWSRSASRIAKVRVTMLAEQMRPAQAGAEDCLNRISAQLIDEASSAGKQMEAYHGRTVAVEQGMACPARLLTLCPKKKGPADLSTSRPFYNPAEVLTQLAETARAAIVLGARINTTGLHFESRRRCRVLHKRKRLLGLRPNRRCVKPGSVLLSHSLAAAVS